MQSVLLDIIEIEKRFSTAHTQDDYNAITEMICSKKRPDDEYFPDTLLLCALLVEHVCLNDNIINKSLKDVDALVSKGFEYLKIEETINTTRGDFLVETLLDKEFILTENQSLIKRYAETKKDLKFNFILSLTTIHMNISQFSTDAFIEKMKLTTSPTLRSMERHEKEIRSKYKTTDKVFTFTQPSQQTQEEIDNIVNPVNIKNFLDKRVVGQDDAKIGIAVALSSHLISYYNHTDCQPNISLLIGPTGSGKTMIAKEIEKYSSLPTIFIESSQITKEGWKGLDKSLILKELRKKARSLREAEYGIVVMDEFDKTCFIGRSSNNENVGESNQGNYLSLFDGSEIRDENGTVYKTCNLMFILTGAFSHFDEHAKETNKIGFNQIMDENKPTEEVRKILVKMGLLPEMVGRITNILRVTPLSEEEAFDAIFSPESDFVKYLNGFKKQTRKTIEISSLYAREKIKTALENELGIRGCISSLKEDFAKALFNAYSENENTIRLGFEQKKEAEY